jgi:transcriptional regulator GlxA family with amidase domain
VEQAFVPKLDKAVSITVPEAKRRRIVAIALPESDPLEIVGPLEVLSAANLVLSAAADRPDLGYDIEVAGISKGNAYAWNGMRIVIDKTYDEISGPIDTVLVQAVDPKEKILENEPFLAWLRTTSTTARRISSICTGTYALAQAGLLNGRHATTHWAWCENLRSRYPEVLVDADPIYVCDGNIYTSAGGTAGMDLMLAFVEADFGREVALKTAQLLVVYLKRPGGQAQFSVQLSTQLAERGAIRDVQAWVSEHLGEGLSVEAMAERAHMSPRNFARVFTRETGITPARYVERLRVEAARQRLEESSAGIGQISHACGFGTPEAMRQAFVRHLKISPREYRAKFAGEVQST